MSKWEWVGVAVIIAIVVMAVLSAWGKVELRKHCNARGGVYIEYQCLDFATGKLK